MISIRKSSPAIKMCSVLSIRGLQRIKNPPARTNYLTVCSQDL